jgi:Ras GTPase-activating protein 1
LFVFYFLFLDATEKHRRGLVLVSKTLQNLSNGIEFGGKEDFMSVMNTFLSSNTKAMDEFLDQISV